MVAQNLRHPSARKASKGAPRPQFCDVLESLQLVDKANLAAARAIAARSGQSLPDVLRAHDFVSEAELALALATRTGCDIVAPDLQPPDPRLVDAFGAARCLKFGLLPWRRLGGRVIVAASRPDLFDRHAEELARKFGPVALCVATPSAIAHSLLALRGPQLARQAETRLRPEESCRGWQPNLLIRRCLAVCIFAVALALVAPQTLVTLLWAWTIATLLLTVALKALTGAATLRQRHGKTALPATPAIARLPRISILVPLFRETNIAPRLVRRLGRIDYPRELLDVLLLVEEDDTPTHDALQRAALPGWMRIVTVPDGQVKTKPRAMNHALTICRGSIIGIYDAEDAPEPDQLRKVAARFQSSGPALACLQGILDYYNPRTNWISRCFTIEYASWFRVILPGLQALGLVVPLGGTTLFLRREAIEKVGGWDAHNVTEDADLGIRLARHGYRTEMIETATFEEANCRPLPWVRQRSRWLKGFMVTWAVHMRRPSLTLRQLGWWRFLGLQVLLLGTISQFLMAPLLWAFWLGSMLGAVPLPTAGVTALSALFVAIEGLNIMVGVMGLSARGSRSLIPWVLTLPLYFPMATLAAYKAAWELFFRPFYWDKTSHGIFDDADAPPACAAATTGGGTPPQAPANGAVSATSTRPHPA